MMKCLARQKPPNAAFRLMDNVGIGTRTEFGADPHALFPCCVRFALVANG